MAIDYSKYITDDQKKKLLEERLTRFAAEAYEHSINKQVAEAIEDEAAIENAEKSLAILEAAIDAHEAELKGLN